MTLSSGLRFVADEATILVKRLPLSVVEVVAETLASATSTDLVSCRASLVRDLAHANYRNIVVAFFDGWRSNASEVSSQAVAAALLTAASTEQTHRDSQSVELVWTGPDTEQTPFRRTEQAILQVLDGAKSRITLVSFAVYRIPVTERLKTSHA